MSFICKECGPVSNCKSRYTVATKIRDVEYELQLKTIYNDGESLKTIKRTFGTEIVEEDLYCKKHVPKKVEPKKEGKAIRKQLVKTIFKRMNNNKDEER